MNQVKNKIILLLPYKLLLYKLYEIMNILQNDNMYSIKQKYL